MADISVRPGRTLVNEDQRWIAPGGIHAMADADSITLARGGFDLVTQFPNGIIPSGVALGKITASGKYKKYDDAAVDGSQVCVGFLMTSIVYDRNSTADMVGALYWKGEVVESFLPTNNGLDAAGKTDLAAKFRFV